MIMIIIMVMVIHLTINDELKKYEKFSLFIFLIISFRLLIYNQHLQKKQKKKVVKLQVCFNRNTFFFQNDSSIYECMCITMISFKIYDHRLSGEHIRNKECSAFCFYIFSVLYLFYSSSIHIFNYFHLIFFF